MSVKKYIYFKIGLFTLILLIKGNFILSQPIEEIYCQLPIEYLQRCPLGHLTLVSGTKRGENGEIMIDMDIDRRKLKQILNTKLLELNKAYSHPLQTKIIDNKNSYIKLCDYGCSWEFTMKTFISKDAKKKYVAIWAGNNDGATSGTNKDFYFLQISKNKNRIDFKDVTDKFTPKLSFKEVLTLKQYKQFEQYISKNNYDDYNLLQEFELPYASKPIMIATIFGGDVFCLNLSNDNDSNCIALLRLLQSKSFIFKWNGNKFNRINKS